MPPAPVAAPAPTPVPIPAAPRPPQPYNALQWAPPNFSGTWIWDPQARFVVVADSRWIHATVCAIARQLGARFNFGSDAYKPRRIQKVSIKLGTLWGDAFDPTHGFLAHYGAVTVGWNLSPRGYTSVRANMGTADFGSTHKYATEFFPQFALTLYQAFVDNRMLVWAGEMGNQWTMDIGQWPTAPGSPTASPPEDTTIAGEMAARQAGWQSPLI
jgi:hypothetical protein